MTKAEQVAAKRAGYFTACREHTLATNTECQKRAERMFPMPQRMRTVKIGGYEYRNNDGTIEFSIDKDEWRASGSYNVERLREQYAAADLLLNHPTEDATDDEG